MKQIRILIITIFSLLLAFCGGKTDQELYDEGIELISESKYDEAIAAFENLVEENVKSELAPKAIFECAKIYQGQVSKNITGRESLLKSVELYKKVSNNYPSSSEAENSLFMAGFILANELIDLNGAKAAYELYLQKYPEGELADDARVELMNLGKTPEQILMEKIQNEKSDETEI